MNLEDYTIETKFDELDSNRVSQIYLAKPKAHEWFTIHSSGGSKPLWMVGSEDGRLFVLNPQLVPAVNRTDRKQYQLYPIITTNGHMMVWPVPVSDKESPYASSVAVAIQCASRGWARISWDAIAMRYNVSAPTAEMSEPLWPQDLTVTEIYEMALNDRMIDHEDHKVLRHLRGDV